MGNIQKGPNHMLNYDETLYCEVTLKIPCCSLSVAVMSGGWDQEVEEAVVQKVPLP